MSLPTNLAVMEIVVVHSFAKTQMVHGHYTEPLVGDHHNATSEMLTQSLPGLDNSETGSTKKFVNLFEYYISRILYSKIF